LEAEKAVGNFVRTLITEGVITACHDLSDGGLSVALAEMCMSGKIGATISAIPEGIPAHAALYGEDQARYAFTIKATDKARLVADAAKAGVALQELGSVGGKSLSIASLINLEVATMTATNENWMPKYMAGEL
jgi:phosphoribosylformylglycinamidine (FGAM) synthase-like enzyme